MIAIYPGSFDPLTLGHEDIIKRAALFFDRLIVAVGVNDSKQYMIDTEDRVKLIKLACKSIKNLDVISYHGLTVQLAKEKKADFIIRSIRNSVDFDYESQQANVNRDLDETIETIFFAPTSLYRHVSSSLVRQVVAVDGDISPFVSDPIKSFLLKK